jgi:hypothetical protein
MPRASTIRRTWTATEIYKLKGLAKKTKVGVKRIARALKRTVTATAFKASVLEVSLDMRQ